MDPSFATTTAVLVGDVLSQSTRLASFLPPGSPRIVVLAGEHDFDGAGKDRELIAAAGVCDIAVDMSGVTFMDASTIGVLVAARNRLQANGYTLTIRDASPFVLRLLSFCSLTDLLRGPSSLRL